MRQSLGPGRLLVAVYAVFAISAVARSSFQLSFEFKQAPVAYSLSALSAAVYLFATIALAKPNLRRFAKPALWFEFLGVLTVGSLSILLPEWFNHPSVWSGFGIGYGFVPLVLPVVTFFWLRKLDA